MAYNVYHSINVTVGFRVYSLSWFFRFPTDNKKDKSKAALHLGGLGAPLGALERSPPGGGLDAALPALTRPKAAHLLNASNLRVFIYKVTSKLRK